MAWTVRTSRCVSDIFNGTAPDIGWKESPFIMVYKGPFYVDATNGLDEYPGSFQQPFRTIQEAITRISPGIQVTSATAFIFPGIYNGENDISSNKKWA